LAIPSTWKQKPWKTKEEMVRPDLGAGMDQQDPNCVGDDDDDKNTQKRTESMSHNRIYFQKVIHHITGNKKRGSKMYAYQVALSQYITFLSSLVQITKAIFRLHTLTT
jgi:hypothetical protein